MTFVFPYQGARGGFFHSSAALLPLLWAMAPPGLNSILDWTHHTLGWKVREPQVVFSVAILFFALFLTIFTTGTKFLSIDQKPPQWEQNRRSYQNTEAALRELGANLEDTVLTINPPGYYAYTHRPAIAIPDGSIQTVLQVADQFHGRYLILEAGHPDGLAKLYANPETNHPRLKYLTSVEETHIFIIE
jgi:hypothetical protein